MKKRKSQGVSLNKIISNSGLCSRRAADTFIEQGRVTINGKIARLGYRVVPGDEVRVDGEKIKTSRKEPFTILCNKPSGVTASIDLNMKDNLLNNIKHPHKLYPIGQLEKSSQGLFLVTDDSDLSIKLFKAQQANEHEFIVTVDKTITQEFIDELEKGVKLEGRRTKPCKAVQTNISAFKITFKQKLPNQLRRMCMVMGYKAKKIKRIGIKNLKLKDTGLGYYRVLTQEEVDQFLATAKK